MTLKEYYIIHRKDIDRLIFEALKEDNAKNDITTRLVLPGKKSDRIKTAGLVCKEDCILAGIEIFKKVFTRLDKRAFFKQYFKDGDYIKRKSLVLQVRSSVKTLLAGERTALNFLQRMSGIATLTNQFVKRLKFKHAKILHTRKTTPNFRIFEIAAVKTGGGDFHRFDLSSAVMIKDNHISASGHLEDILVKLQKLKKKTECKDKFEVEVKNFYELERVIRYGSEFVKVVMLDNFSPVEVEQSAELLNKFNIKIEISGGINPENFDEYQNPFVDYYSVGMLTHSYSSVDFSLEF
ncbi:MAG: carboxylating nicotinate-nucleotide diphosphorylase [Ignavibacteria bacterium]|jgi:nicotinate-nucleotide pyrophosphorylase (carboxylating)